MNVDNHIKATVSSKMNDIASQLHEHIRKVVHDEAERKEKSTTEAGSKVQPSTQVTKAQTTKDLREVKQLLRVISADLEYPNEQKDTYKKFLEIEQFYNDRLETADYEFFDKFKQMMIDFKAFLVVAISRMTKTAVDRAREQAVDILHDVDYFLRIDGNKKENYFPDTSIKKRADYLDAKDPTSIRVLKAVNASPEKIDQLVVKLGAVLAQGANQKTQVEEVTKMFPMLTQKEAQSYLVSLKAEHAELAPKLPRAEAPALAPALAPQTPALYKYRGSASAQVSPSFAFASPVERAQTPPQPKTEEEEITDDIFEALDNISYRGLTEIQKQSKEHDDAVSYLRNTKSMSSKKAKAFVKSNNVIDKYNELHGSGLDAKADNLLATKGKYDFSKAVQNTVKLLSFNNEFNEADIKGSSSFKSLTNPSDYDMFQKVYENASLPQAVKDITKKMQDVVKRLMKQKQLYIIDIKCGLDDDLVFDLPKSSSGKLSEADVRKVLHFLTNAYKNDYISESQYKDGVELVHAKNMEEYLDLKDYLRRLKTLRWDPADFVKGKMELHGDREVQLSDAIKDRTMVKIDCISKAGSRLVEFSNIYEFYARNEPINAVETDYVKAIKEEIYMLYVYKKYAKMDKRILLLDRYYKNTENVKKLTELFNGNLGILNKLKSDIEVIVSLLEKFPSNLPWATICDGLDNMRERFATIYEFDIKSEDINDSLAELSKLSNNEQNRERMLHDLETILEYCGNILNKEALAFNKKHGLEPLPKKYY